MYFKIQFQFLSSDNFLAFSPSTRLFKLIETKSDPTYFGDEGFEDWKLMKNWIVSGFGVSGFPRGQAIHGYQADRLLAGLGEPQRPFERDERRFENLKWKNIALEKVLTGNQFPCFVRRQFDRENLWYLRFTVILAHSYFVLFLECSLEQLATESSDRSKAILETGSGKPCHRTVMTR